MIDAPILDGIKLLEGLAVVTGIAGSILNARGKKSSFYVWTASNVLLAVLMIRADYFLAAALYGVYCVINFYGMYIWSRRPPVAGADRP